MPPPRLGKHNPRLTEIRKAFRQGGLTPDGLLPIEGPHLVEEARSSGLEIVELFAPEGTPDPSKGERRHTVAPSVFRSIGATREPHAVIALVRPPQFALETVLSVRRGLFLVLCGLQDPGNAGTIVRLADAFGASGCLATRGTVGLYNDKLVRASAGSLFRLPHCWDLDLDQLAEYLRSMKVRIVGTARDAAMEADAFDWRPGAAVLIGNEGSGLGERERARCDTMVRITHSDRVDSLNAASAAAILLYEAARRRRKHVSI